MVVIITSAITDQGTKQEQSLSRWLFLVHTQLIQLVCYLYYPVDNVAPVLPNAPFNLNYFKLTNNTCMPW